MYPAVVWEARSSSNFKLRGARDTDDVAPGGQGTTAASRRFTARDATLFLQQRRMAVVALPMWLGSKNDGNAQRAMAFDKQAIASTRSGAYLKRQLRLMSAVAPHAHVATLSHVLHSKRRIYAVASERYVSDTFERMQQQNAGRFSDARARRYFTQLLLGLQHIHARSVNYSSAADSCVKLPAYDSIALLLLPLQLACGVASCACSLSSAFWLHEFALCSLAHQCHTLLPLYTTITQ